MLWGQNAHIEGLNYATAERIVFSHLNIKISRHNRSDIFHKLTILEANFPEGTVCLLKRPERIFEVQDWVSDPKFCPRERSFWTLRFTEMLTETIKLQSAYLIQWITYVNVKGFFFSPTNIILINYVRWTFRNCPNSLNSSKIAKIVLYVPQVCWSF